MQTVSPGARAAMDAVSVEAFPEAVFEFDHSLMHDSVVTGIDSRDEVLFPKESITTQRYINSGVPRALVGAAKTMDKGTDLQFRVVDESDTYKYYVPRRTALSTGTMNNCWFAVEYDKARPTNKVVVVFEVSMARPTEVYIDVLKAGGWERITSNAAPNNDGVITYYPQSNGTWSTTYNTSNPQDVKGIRVTIRRMSERFIYPQVIAVSARYLVDMTDRLTDFNVNKTLENPSPLSPLGETAVNSLDLSLENSDQLLDPENEDSPFYKLMSRNVRINTGVRVGGELIPQGKFFAESWENSAPSVEVGVSCSDVTRFMQETDVAPFFLWNYNVRQAVREILQRVGFNFDDFIVYSDHNLRFIWYSDSVTVWQALKDLAAATLSYFYIDEFGRFIWVDFDSMKQAGPQATLDAGTNLNDLSHEFDVVANKINIEYNIYGWPTDPVSGERITQQLWAPPEDDALLGMGLAEDLPRPDYNGPGGTYRTHSIKLLTDLDGMRMWPDEGYVNIQGERIQYTEKNDNARTLSGLRRSALRGSMPRTHRTNNIGTLSSVGPPGARVLTNTGNLRIAGPGPANLQTYNLVVFGNRSNTVNPTQHKVYGTTLMFPNNTRDETAGLVIHRRGDHGGLFFEIMTTPQSIKRNQREIRVYRRSLDGTVTNFFGDMDYEVAIQNWYDIEVVAEYTQDPDVYNVYVNGMFVLSFTEGRGNVGQFGCYVRGRSRADFKRLWVADGPGTTVGRNFQDVVSGSSFSSDYVFETDDPTISVNEFAPIVRQIKEYDVEFEKFPATSASILNTNHWQARPLGFKPDAFGARFFMENKADGTAVINGTSPNLFPEPMDMALMVYGHPIIVAAEERREVRDNTSIRRNGEVELEVSNPWIQSKEMADRVGNTIVANFAEAQDVVSASVFPDFALQLGDTVSIDYPEHGYHPNKHQYYVLDIGLNWSNGFSQTLTLRRKRTV